MDNLGAIVGPLARARPRRALLGSATAILLSSSRACSRPRRSSTRSARRRGSSATSASRSGCASARCCRRARPAAARDRRLRGRQRRRDAADPARHRAARARARHAATQLAIVLYIAYNLAATLVSFPAGRARRPRAARRACSPPAPSLFAAAYSASRRPGRASRCSGACFVAAGVGIGWSRPPSTRRRAARARGSARLGVRPARRDPEPRQPRRQRGRRPALDARLARAAFVLRRAPGWYSPSPAC